jgi:hypothetical protein
MKIVKSLMLSSVLVVLGLNSLPSVAQAQFKDTQVNALVEALKQAAPPNRPNDGMYSPWQVLPSIIPSWTKQCLGKEMNPSQFESNEKEARQTVGCIVKRELQTQAKSTPDEQEAVKNVACWWMTGTNQGCKSGATATYVQRVLDFYQQQRKS